MWQQDSTPCHTSGKSLKWLSENFHHFTSPNFCFPNPQPHCNRIDYFMRDMVQKDSNCSFCSTKVEMVVIIKAVFFSETQWRTHTPGFGVILWPLWKLMATNLNKPFSFGHNLLENFWFCLDTFIFVWYIVFAFPFMQIIRFENMLTLKSETWIMNL